MRGKLTDQQMKERIARRNARKKKCGPSQRTTCRRLIFRRSAESGRTERAFLLAIGENGHSRKSRCRRDVLHKGVFLIFVTH